MKPSTTQSFVADRDDDDLIRLLQKRQAELNSLFEVAQAINKDAPIDTLLRMAQYSLKYHIHIGKALLLVKDESHGFSSLMSYGFVLPKATDLNLIGTILSKFDKRTYLKGSNVDETLSYFDYFLPVVNKNQKQVAVYVLIGDFNPSIATIENNLKFIETLVSLISVSIENKRLLKERIQRERLQRDIELAKELQERLIPKGLTKISGIQINSKYMAHHAIGGDYFDVIEHGSDEIVWCIADVSGKGVSAALLMANIQASLRAWVSTGMDLTNIVSNLNRTVFHYADGDRYLTMFIARYHRTSRMMEYINAGHPPSILIDDIGPRLLNEGTTIIGAFEELPFLNLGEVEIFPDSILINYTDGLIERDEGEVLDETILTQWLKDYPKGQPLETMNNHLLTFVDNYFSHTPSADDVTLLNIRIP